MFFPVSGLKRIEVRGSKNMGRQTGKGKSFKYFGERVEIRDGPVAGKVRGV